MVSPDLSDTKSSKCFADRIGDTAAAPSATTSLFEDVEEDASIPSTFVKDSPDAITCDDQVPK